MIPHREFRTWNDPHMKTPLKRILAQNVRRLMKGVPEVSTQAKLAVRARMSQSSIHRILNEDTEPEIETVGKLADAIGVPIGVLLTEFAEDGADMQFPISYEKYSALPTSEKEKIKSFIEFIVASHDAAKRGALSTHTERIEPSETHREAAQKLAQRKPSDQTLTSHERQNITPQRQKKPNRG